jgi:metal-responsive CopG/Arc/MetJ family transcriptional regulator
MGVISANVDDDLVEWADRYHAALGYRSRSALITEALREMREAAEAADEEVEDE